MLKMGVQGAQGSFSEQAAHTFAKRKGIESYEIVYLISSANVLDHVSKGKVDYGIFAIENAQGGVVIESILAMAEHQCTVVDMFHYLVIQNLLALPGVSQSDIKEIHSHQQALRQCKHYIADHFMNCQRVEEDDTAEAARRLSEGQLPPSAAVIANLACAEHYKLNVLCEGIQDLKNNLTLFLAVEQYEKQPH